MACFSLLLLRFLLPFSWHAAKRSWATATSCCSRARASEDSWGNVPVPPSPCWGVARAWAKASRARAFRSLRLALVQQHPHSTRNRPNVVRPPPTTARPTHSQNSRPRFDVTGWRGMWMGLGLGFSDGGAVVGGAVVATGETEIRVLL